MAKTPRTLALSTGLSLIKTTTAINQSDLNPIGMIVSSMLTQAQFQALNGTSWVLMDGRSVAGSSYATVTGSNTIPDARGLVLRGKNNARADGNQNPDGDLTLGAFQGHATAKSTLSINDPGHSHYVANAPGGQIPGGPWNVIQDSSGLAPSGLIQGANANTSLIGGDNETRMKNISVNHFIKINP